MAYSAVEAFDLIYISFLAPQFPTGFKNYEMHHERRSSLPAYHTYPPRSSPPIMATRANSRKLPPLSTSLSPLDEHQSRTEYVPPAISYSDNNIRSSTAIYPNQNHFMQQDHASMDPQSHCAMFEDIPRLGQASCTNAHTQPRSANELAPVVSDIQ